MRCLAGFAGVLVAAMTLAPSFAAAQSPEGLELKPAVVEDNAAPGQIFQLTVRVTNIGRTDKTFYLSAKDIKGLDDAGLPVFASPEETTDYSLSSWIDVPKTPLTLKAGEMRAIPFSVRVPSDASPGAHFGGIFLTSEAPQLDASGAAIGISVGTIVSLKIAGDVVEDAQLREFSTDRFVYGSSTVVFSARIANRGNVLVRPHGLIEVTDMFGKKVGSLTVNDSAAPVFPGSDKAYPVSWTAEGFAFGRYQAVVSLVYGDEARKTISGATSFWILPLTPILTVLGIVLALFLGLYLGVRRYIRKTLRSMGASAEQADHALARRGRSASRLTVALAAVFVFVLLFLGFLFVFFA